MKRVLSWLVLGLGLLLGSASAQTAKNQATLSSENSTSFPSCASNCITAAQLRAFNTDMIYSYWNLLNPPLSGVTAASYGPGFVSFTVGSDGRLTAAASRALVTSDIPTGTSGAVIPLLSTNNIWSGSNAFNAGLNITALASGTISATFGTSQSGVGTAIWNVAPLRNGMALTNTNNIGNNSTDEFLSTFQTTTAATNAPAVATNAQTLTSSAVLNFASVPATVVAGMTVSDTTTPGAIVTQTVLSTTSTSVTLSANVSATVNAGDNIIFTFNNFKGPLYVATVQNDPSYLNGVHAGNGATIYSEIGTGTTNAYVEGVVSVAQGNGTGTGVLIGGEFDISPDASDTANSNHCDATGVSDCHTNFWAANFGAIAGSWVMDTGSSAPGWRNGIALRAITSGGLGVEVPTNVSYASRNAANNADLALLFNDSSNNTNVQASGGNINLNYGTSSVLSFQSNGVTKATISNVGTFTLVNNSSASLGDPTHQWNSTYSTNYFAGASATQGVSCSGTPTASFASISGIVTHC